MCSPFCQPDIAESQCIKIRLIPDVGKYPCLTGYWYPHRVIILVVCTLMFLVDSHIRELQNRGISTKTPTSTICSKKLIPFYSEVPRSSYKTKSGDTCFVICLTSRTFAFAIVADENIHANMHIDPSQVGQEIPLFTTKWKQQLISMWLLSFHWTLFELSNWCVWLLASAWKWDSRDQR